jgi:hypothetical protein
MGEKLTARRISPSSAWNAKGSAFFDEKMVEPPSHQGLLGADSAIDTHVCVNFDAYALDLRRRTPLRSLVLMSTKYLFGSAE